MRSSSTTPERAGREPALDVLRGVAITMVLARHAYPDLFGCAGVVGVTVFFVLSGYLITGALERDIMVNGRVSYGRFYRARALRLLPALLACLVGFAVIAVLLYEPDQRDKIIPTLIIGLTYVANLPGLEVAGGMSHLWTLATEEQFYLLWPLVLLFAIRRRRVKTVVVTAASIWILIMIVASVIAADDPARLYRLPTSWAEAMLGGAALRLMRPLGTRQGWAWVAGGILIALCFLPDAKNHLATYLVVGPVVTVSTCFVIAAVRKVRTVPMMLAPLMWLGTISYGAYLWNHLIMTATHELAPDSKLVPLVATCVTLLVATGSWIAIERPVMRWKSRLDNEARAASMGRVDSLSLSKG